MKKLYENKQKIVGISLFGILILLFLLMVCFFLKRESDKREKYYNVIENTYNEIEFKGEVLSIQRIHRGGRTYGLACIKLDSTSTMSFYRYDKMSCLKIENNIATFPVGFLGDGDTKISSFILQSVYVNLNMEEKGKVLFYNKENEFISLDLYFGNNNLRESDMNICD